MVHTSHCMLQGVALDLLFNAELFGLAESMAASLRSSASPALIEINGYFTPLTPGDLHMSPFRISPRDKEGSPGIEVKRHIGAIARLSLREPDFQQKIDGTLSRASIQPSPNELKAHFRTWLEEQIIADQWRSKASIRDIAKKQFGVVRRESDKIRSELLTDHNRPDWTKGGRRN